MSVPIRLSAAFVKSLVRSKDDTAIKRCRKQRKAATRPNNPSEADIQAAVVQFLRLTGYKVLETGQYIESQRRVNDNGLPDLVIRHPKWKHRGMCLLIEMKEPVRGKPTPEQKEFWLAGGSYICTSLEAVQEILKLQEWRIDE